MRDLRIRALPDFFNRHAHFLFATILTALAMGCLAGLWRIVAASNLHVALDPNEGWNAYHTASTMAGHSPYPGSASFMTNNYPPLSFYLVGLLGGVLGDNIIAGRIVSLISFLVVAGGIASLARRFGVRSSDAAFASLVFAGLLLVFSDYVGMDDPQMLGHALQIFGLLLLVKNEKSLPADLAGAALFVAGLFVKHNLVAMPIATIIWLSLGDWRRVRAGLLHSCLFWGSPGSRSAASHSGSIFCPASIRPAAIRSRSLRRIFAAGWFRRRYLWRPRSLREYRVIVSRVFA